MPDTTHRPRRPLVLAAASVVLIAVGVTAIVALTNGDDGPSPDAAPVETARATAASTTPSTIVPASTPAPTTAPPPSPPPTTVPREPALLGGVPLRTLDERPDITPIEEVATSVTDLPYDAAQLAADDESLWITKLYEGSLERRLLPDLSPAGTIADTQPTFAFGLARPVVAFGSVWTSLGDEVVRSDIESMSVTVRVPMPNGGTLEAGALMSDLAAAPDGVWTLQHDPDGTYAVRIDPVTSTIASRYRVGDTARSIAYAAGSLWVVHGFDGPSLARVDPATGTELARVDLPFVPLTLVGDDGGVWVNGQLDDELRPMAPTGNWVVGKVDPTTNALVAVVEVQSASAGSIGVATTELALGGGALWMPTPEGLVRIDAETAVMTARYSGNEGGITVTGGAAWFVDSVDRALYRIPFDG